MIPLTNGYLRTTISEIDFALAIYCALGLIQDATRYRYLRELPKLTLFSDTAWLSTIVVLFFFGSLAGDIGLYWFLGLTIAGPLLGCSVFLFLSKPEIGTHVFMAKQLAEPQRRYLLVQSIFGTAVTILILFVLARNCTADELKTIRIIQTIASPFYALAAGYWLTVVTSGSNNKNLNEVLPRTIRRLFTYSLCLPMVLTVIYFIGQKIDLHFYSETLALVIIAISVPIVNAITYPTNWILRFLGQYKSSMKISLTVTGLFFCSIVYAGNMISAILYFTLQFLSILVIQSLNIKLCIRIRSSNREYEGMEDNR
jgi:hypothetical protein